jgi:adenosylcobinamide kinase/adenosylcobinamide-phosphate guanylyltransferase
MLELVIGGARSGKSTYAEQCAKNYSEQNKNLESEVLYIATATAGDDEMTMRIAHHKQSRPDSWQTVEEPVKLAALLEKFNQPSNFLIVDCLTLWLTNLFSLDPEQKQREIDSLLTTLPGITSSVIFVTNEIGMGVVPLGETTRQFVDEAGRLHQLIAGQCHRVTQMVAGIPNIIKDVAKK